MSRSSSPFLIVEADCEGVEEATEADRADQLTLDAARQELAAVMAQRHAAEAVIVAWSTGRGSSSSSSSGLGETPSSGADAAAVFPEETSDRVASAVLTTNHAVTALRAEEQRLLLELQALAGTTPTASTTAVAAAAAQFPNPTTLRIAQNAITLTDDECDVFFQQKMTAAERQAVTTRVVEMVPDYDKENDSVVRDCFSCPITMDLLEDPHTVFGHTYSGDAIKRWVRLKGSHPVFRDRPTAEADIYRDIATRNAMDEHVKREQQILAQTRTALQRSFVREKLLDVKSLSFSEETRRLYEASVAEDRAVLKGKVDAMLAAATVEQVRQRTRESLVQQRSDVRDQLRAAEAAAAAALAAADNDLQQSAESAVATARTQLSTLIAREEGKRRELQLLMETIAMKRRSNVESKMRWEPEKSNCSVCGQGFSLLVKRGRCHRCGLNVCYSCSQNVGRRFALPSTPPTAVAAAQPSPHPVAPICQKCFGVCHRELKIRYLRNPGSATRADFASDGHPLFEVLLAGESWLTGDASLHAGAALRAASGVTDASPSGGLGIAMEVLSDVVVPSVLAYVAAAGDFCRALVTSSAAPAPLVSQFDEKKGAPRAKK